MHKIIGSLTPGTAGVPQTETMTDPSETKSYPTIERLADLSQTTTSYQGPVLVEEAVRCWYALASLADELRLVWERYDELIYAVGNKYPGETRHQTALRYIKRAEEPSTVADAAMKEPR